MKYKTKDYTVKFHHYCEEDNMNVYHVIDNNTKKVVYYGYYRDCVDFLKRKETEVNNPSVITININADSQETLIEVYRIDTRTFVGYTDKKLLIYYLETNEYFPIKVLAENIVCEEWDRMIEKEDLHRQCTI